MTTSTDPYPSSRDITEQSLGERIYEELTDGKYECPICVESINEDSAIWNCGTCHHIYHFNCVEKWSTTNHRFGSWNCPTCKTPHSISSLSASCWCGRTRHADVNHQGNSCGSVCGNMQTCNGPELAKCIKRCFQFCHPGPCEALVCALGCPNRVEGSSAQSTTLESTNLQRIRISTAPALGATAPISLPNRATTQPGGLSTSNATPSLEVEEVPSTYRGRWASIDKDVKTDMFFSLFWLIGLSAILLWFARFNAQKTTRPMENKVWTLTAQGRFNKILIAGQVLYVFFVVPFVVLSAKTTFEVLRMLPNPKSGMRLFVSRMLVSIAAIGMISAYTITAFGVRAEYWHRQMRHSCDSFDRRANLDTELASGERERRWSPVSNFKLSDPSLKDIKLFGDLDLTTDEISIIKVESIYGLTNDTLSDFYRVSRKIADRKQISVDFDVVAHTWRMTSTPFSSVIWSVEYNRMIPNFRDSVLIKNGTWDSVSDSSPHSRIPELNLQIPNYYYFLRRCKFQYFMKIFRTDGMSEAAILQQSQQAWSSSSESNVVMRTLSSGRSIQALEVCAKKDEYRVANGNGGWIRKPGLGDDFIVPLGLLSVIRLDMEADGNRITGDGQCSL